ncbi:CG9715 [Drosophila busckii]|uniref:Zinc finger CCHC domain-containing protein 7 n=1 Tax=Drosophila busckii TaxID=30019 RepID=A0A0M4EG07_DROBS|nr:CG9715 [Drosophila busckii]
MNREHLSDVFKRIDEHAADAKRKQQHPELEREPVSRSEMEERSVEIVDEELELAKLTELDEDKQDEEMEPQHPVDVLMAPTMRALQDQPRGGDLVGWNMEMCRFYNDSWHGEHFSLNKLYKGMSGHRNDWRIMNSDRYPVARKRSNFKCTNCLEMGHVRVKCPRPRKPIVCYTCGNTGHAEPRCPNAICLGCGSKQALYVQKCNKCSFHSRVVCQICKMRGHTTELCPDKWRRYHSTTRSNVQLESNVQYRTKHCSYCAARGHLFEECRQRMGEFRQQVYTSQIISHQKTYKDRTGRLSYLEDTPALFPIETPFHFNWDSEFASNSCYARFLKVVGLAKPPEKIRRLKAPPQQVYTNDYVPNPQAKAASSKQQIQLKEITSNTQTKANVSKINTHELDSDSNYSFSEHFELPSSTTTSNEEQPTSSAMPDMIPLSTTPEPEEQLPSTSQQQQQPQRIQGISMCVNTKLNAVPEAASNTSTGLGDLPTEARILMARDQTEYLFSPEGREFLTDSAKQCQVSVRMDFKEYGYVLVIYGVKKQQEQLQLLLMHRHQQVKNKTKEFTSQLPPKRVDVLIRFIRDGIASLQKASLGKPHDHYQRIKQLEQQNTKHSYKLAASKRRLLNMILLGQAGLGNGTMHLDKLLLILGKLIEEYPAVEVATPALRQEIDDHWRVIFTAYPHENYDELLFDYVMLKNKNRLTQLMIDPKLMGIQPRKPAAVLLTPYQPQQQQQQQQQQPQQQRSPKQRGKPTTLPHACEDQDQEQAPAAPSMRPPKQKPPKTKPRQVVPVINTRRQLPVNDPHQRSPSNLRLEKHLRPECVRLLADMENGTQDSHKINTDATKPSMFWSRESLQYLDDLFKLTDNAATIERLQRVLERSRRGQLSHNDYRAVIKLHSVMAHN